MWAVVNVSPLFLLFIFAAAPFYVVAMAPWLLAMVIAEKISPDSWSEEFNSYETWTAKFFSSLDEGGDCCCRECKSDGSY